MNLELSYLYISIKQICQIGIKNLVLLNEEGFIKFTKRSLISYLIFFMVFSGTGIIYLFNPFGTQEAEAAWFNDNWAYREAIPVTSTNGSAQSNVFLSFSLNTSSLISTKLQSSCQDIRITDQSGKILPYHVGRTNACNNAATTIDFLVSSFPDLKSTYYVYYGNPSAKSADAGAFSQSQASNYSVASLASEENAPTAFGYWKFNEGIDNTCTGGSNDACNSGTGGSALDAAQSNMTSPSTTSGWQSEDQCVSGKCLRFNGTNNIMTSSGFADAFFTGNWTQSLWIKTTQSGNNVVTEKGSNNAFIQTNSGQIRAGTTNNVAADVQDTTGAPLITDGSWHFVAVTFNSSTKALVIYIDGISRGSRTTTNNSASSATAYAIGSRVGIAAPFGGSIDEVKVYNFTQSAAQVLADYNARSNPEGLSAQFGNNKQNMPSTLTNGLVGYWKMDEASYTGNCSAADLADSSGNANTAKICPNASGPTVTAGKYGNATNFDGSNDYAEVANSTILNPSYITLSAWVNLTSTANDQMIIDKGADVYSLAYSFTNSNIYFNIRDPSGSTIYSSIFGNVTITASTWTHLAITYDGTNLNLYKNGALLSTQSFAHGVMQTSDTSAVDIGAHQWWRTNGGTAAQIGWLTGKTDEVRIYNRALSGNDVFALYNWAPGPVGYWPLDEKSGTRYDVSGNGNNLTDNNTVTSNPAKYGTGGQFTAANNESLSITDGSQSGLDFSYGMSISAWFKMDALPGNGGWQEIVAKFGFTGGNNRSYDLQASNSGGVTKLQSEISNDGLDSGKQVITGSTTLAANTWYHAEVTYDGTNIRLYLNGVQDATAVALTAPIFNGAAAFYIGQVDDGGANGRSMNGIIDDVKVYNYGRTSGQVIEDMNGGHPAPGSPVGSPYGYWKFNEGSDNTCSGGTNDVCNSGYGGNTIDGAQSNMASPGTSTSGWTNSGKFGRALNFDGTNDFVSIGDEAGTDSATQATWTFWVNPTTLAVDQCIWCKVNTPSGTPAQSSWAIMTDHSDSSIIRGIIANGAADVSQYGSTPTGTLVNGTWAYIAVVYDGNLAAANRLKIYVNGNAVTTTITGTIPTSIGNTTANAVWGRASSTAANLFAGTIDEPKLYLSALTGDQVKLDMNRSSSEVLGALSSSSTAGNDNASTRTAQSAASEYCIPGDSVTCTAPVGRWDFEEGSGTTANDTSGNGNTGTITGATYKTGKVGKALNFVSTSSQKVVATGLTANSTNFTVEAWINPSSISGLQGIISKIASGPDNGFILRLDSSGGNQVYGIVATAGTSTNTNTVATVSISTNTWTHVAYSYDGSKARLYKNGVLSVDQSASSAHGSNTAALSIGSDYAGAAQYFDGNIDQARYFTYARTPAQVAWDYNRGGPVGWWKMDECQGATIHDSSGNGITGTFTIGPGGGFQTVIGTCSTPSDGTGAWYNGRTGKINSAMSFDQHDDLIDLGSPTALQLQTFTYTAWVKKGVTGFNQGIFVYSSGGNTGGPGFYFNSSDKLELAKTGVAVCTGNRAITDSSWHHVALSYDGANCNFYIDGTLDKTSAFVQTFTYSNNAYIGTHTSGQTEFNGLIDDMRVYNYVLNVTQIKSVMNDGAVQFAPTTGSP